MIYKTEKIIAFRSSDKKTLGKFLRFLRVKKHSYAGTVATRVYNEFFGDCYNLTTVVIPNSLNFIGLLAFDRCDKLFNLYCYAEYPPTIDYSLGEIDLSKITLHVPAASIDIYKNAIEWQNFGNIVALTDDDPNPTGIESTKEDKISYPVSTYTIDGKRINKAQRGLNIIKMSDGTTKKVIIK